MLRFSQTRHLATPTLYQAIADELSTSALLASQRLDFDTIALREAEWASIYRLLNPQLGSPSFGDEVAALLGIYSHSEASLIFLDVAQRAKLDSQLATLLQRASTNQARINFHAETRLIGYIWNELYDSINGSPPVASDIVLSISSTSQRFTLAGPAIRLPTPTKLARVVEQGQFAGMVSTALGMSLSSAKKAMRRYTQLAASGKSIHRTRILSSWAQVPLGKYHMWSTFDASHPNIDELTTRSSRRSARCRLGLGKSKEPLILLQYSVAHADGLRYPTTCDAYAGTCWPYYFRTSTKADMHGWTMQRPDCPRSRPYPECVHEVQDCTSLTSLPIKI